MTVKSLNFKNVQKKFLVTIFILAIIIKSIISYYFFQFDNDKINQAVAAKNFVEGNGLTIKEADPADLSKTIYAPLAGWPPGYSLLLAPIYIITNDIELSAVILMLISNILFFVVLFNLLLYLKLSLFHTILLLLLPAVHFHEYIIWSTPTDLLAVTIYLYACLTALQLIEGSNTIIGFSISNSFSALLRYMYWPISLVLPAILIAIGYKRNDKKLFQRGVISFIIAAIVCGSIYLFEKLYIGDALYIFPTEKGFFPENLLRPYPFIITSFINQDFFAQQLVILFSRPYVFWINLIYYLHMIILIPLIFHFGKYLLNFNYVFNDKKNYFIIISGIISLITILTLIYPSIRYSKFFPLPNNHIWTYFSDSRYYIFPVITFPIISIIIFYKNQPKYKFLKVATLILFVIICVEILHGIYFISKIPMPIQPRTKSYILQKEMENLIKAQIEANNFKNLKTVIASNFSAFPQLASLYGGAGLLKTEVLNSGTIFSAEPCEVLLITQKDYLNFYKEFINHPKVHLQKKIDDYYCYIYKP
jgi:hypothetical protein